MKSLTTFFRDFTKLLEFSGISWNPWFHNLTVKYLHIFWGLGQWWHNKNTAKYYISSWKKLTSLVQHRWRENLIVQLLLTKKLPHSNNLTQGKSYVPLQRNNSKHSKPYLGQLNTKPAIISLLSDFSDSYVTDALQCELPIVLTELYEECAQDLELNDLLTKCNAIKIDVSPAQAAHVEAITREQSSNRLWFRFQSGRTTASKMKAACHTDPCKPALGLVMNICYK